MNILIIGSGGREHALGWKIKQSPLCGKLYFAPGNAGTAALGENVPISVQAIEQLADFAKERIDFTVVGPELPLSLGLVDHFRTRGLRVFGPDRQAAQLETSKVFSKAFMKKHQIPTARYEAYESLTEAVDALSAWAYPVWVKVDGLAAGKGAVFCPDAPSARQTVKAMMRDKLFGQAGERILIEEQMEGLEVTLLCLTDGQTICPMDSARDYKRAQDGNQGPNTGGMGSVSPAPGYAPGYADDIARKTLQGIQAEGLDYRGVLYIGLMLTPQGPKVIEYNARFGDPETEPLMLRLENDLLALMLATEEKRLSGTILHWKPQPAVCVIVASGGYPGAYETGYPLSTPDITGTTQALFHAGTKLRDGVSVTDGGRVMAAVALGEDVDQARTRANALASQIQFEKAFYRKDIAK